MKQRVSRLRSGAEGSRCIASRTTMTIDRTLRGIAGFFVLLSIALAGLSGQVALTRPTWLWFTAFVGLNLLQSAFTNWCPMMALLRKLGMPEPGRGGAVRQA